MKALFGRLICVLTTLASRRPLPSPEKAPEAAETMAITAARLKSLGLIDKIVNEPIGGAHSDHKAMGQTLKRALTDALRQVSGLSETDLLSRRYERLMDYGRFKEQAA